MASKKEQEPTLQTLTEKLKRIGCPDFEVKPGEEKVMMLHIQGHLICGVSHALSLSDEDLGSLIDETVGGGQN